MEQTFHDLYCEYQKTSCHTLWFVGGIFCETFLGILKEHLVSFFMENTVKRLLVWAGGVALLLMIPLVLTLTGSGKEGEGWYWTASDFVFAFVLMFGAGATYEVISKKMTNNTWYKMAVGLAVLTGFLLLWVNAAVGIIGSEDNLANVLYFGVIAIGFLGAIIARLEAKAMAKVLFTVAAVQMAVPAFAFALWQPPFTLGVVRVFMLNAFFAMFWVGSGLLFRQAGKAGIKKA
jgi:hypothetical protein